MDILHHIQLIRLCLTIALTYQIASFDIYLSGDINCILHHILTNQNASDINELIILSKET